MSKFKEHLKWAAEIVASWPPWKRNLLENSQKPTCPAREPVSPREDFQAIPRHDRNPLECSLRPKCPMMNPKPSPAPPVEQKHLVWLHIGYRNAVVIDWSLEDARLRARMHDPQGGWENATGTLITRVRKSRTNLVLAMDGK